MKHSKVAEVGERTLVILGGSFRCQRRVYLKCWELPSVRSGQKNKREDKGFKNKSYYSANIGTACGLSYF